MRPARCVNTSNYSSSSLITCRAAVVVSGSSLPAALCAVLDQRVVGCTASYLYRATDRYKLRLAGCLPPPCSLRCAFPATASGRPDQRAAMATKQSLTLGQRAVAFWNHPAGPKSELQGRGVCQRLGHSVTSPAAAPCTHKSSALACAAIHFWAPTFKWGITIANISDFKRPADQVRTPAAAACCCCCGGAVLLGQTPVY